MEKIKSILKYIWQLSQNVIALIYLRYLIVKNKIPAITKYVFANTFISATCTLNGRKVMSLILE